MDDKYQELHDLVRSLLLVFVGSVRCSCVKMSDSCGECDKRVRLEDYITHYISLKRGRNNVQLALSKLNDSRITNLNIVELSEFLDDLADVYPRLDK